ncbi:hypothetical protein ABT026_07815 [Streptomyces sp. NPDC002734]|uniref:hypothetical protein n=1 Tax=Streptomyces sp. NPDC002734 TaxID=3154426 RepID=UPI00331C19BD
MNTVTHLSAPAVSGAGTLPLTGDHRFALLTARAGLEPELAQRYTSDPVAVLAEFGFAASEPVYGDDFAEAFGASLADGGIGRTLVIDHLDRPGSGAAGGCYGCATIMAPLPGEAGAALA